MSFSELEKLLNLSWSKETCNPRFCDMWTSDNPSLGQSDVTSLVVYNFYGGKIMRCNTSIGDHYYNLVDDNMEYYIEDDNFAELMGLFLKTMKLASYSGGLYCGNVVSK